MNSSPQSEDPTSRNRRFYDGLWSRARLTPPERLSTWPLVRALLSEGSVSRLEIGPGLRPRLPLDGTAFLDISLAALDQLGQQGGRGTCGNVSALPYADDAFDLVAAFDIIEHVEDDAAAFAELARVCRPGGVLLLSVPLHPNAWTAFDEAVGHCRRYDPSQLLADLLAHGFTAERSAPFGMRPRSSRLIALGMWFLSRMPDHAMLWYNRVFFPIALRRQAALVLHDGPPVTEGVGDIVLVCRRGPPGPV
jgi:SAM-dependent methyltransferase